jgi:homoserine O-acetyltransferase/O-succinyltransferase
MSVSVESPAVAARARPGRRLLADARPAVPSREGVLEIAGTFSLYHGGRLSDVRIAWRMVGPAHAPVVCALGGISANRYVCVAEGPLGGDDPQRGWWSQLVGPGGALDTQQLRVLSFDYLGGSGESTAPPVRGEAGEGTPPAFPSVSSYDQAELLARLLDHLSLRSLAAIAGGSYGGMVALAFGERYPERVAQLIIIGAPDRSHPLATAWRAVQRRIVEFAVRTGEPQEGLKLARALAMTSYRSAEELAARFSGAVARDGQRFVFPVEEYLFARGSEYASRHRAETFLCLSESIDLHRIDAGRVFVPTAVVAVREDQLVPLADLRALAARLPRGSLHEISSIYGHDAFLKESHQLRAIFKAALESAT